VLDSKLRIYIKSHLSRAKQHQMRIVMYLKLLGRHVMNKMFNLRLDIDDKTSRRLALPQMTCPFKLKVISTVRAFDRAVANVDSYLRPNLFVEYHNHI